MNRTTPLESRALAHGATPGEEAGWSVARTFAGVEPELAALHERAGVADVTPQGLFRLAGKNSVKFLQGLVTNDVAALAPGQGCFAAFLNVHGRIEAVAHVFALAENDLLLVTPAEATAWVEKSLGRFRLAGGFDLAALDEHATISVVGPEAGQAVATALAGATPPQPGGFAAAMFDGEPLMLFGIPRATTPSVDVAGPAPAVAALWDRLVSAGVQPVGADAMEVARLEAGIARFARDYDAETVLQEADLPGVVSYTKGCYLGQEIVARLHYLGQPSRLLRRLDVGAGALPAVGAEVVSADDETKVAGRVTSVAASPTDGPIVFASVKRKYYAPGTAVRVRAGDGLASAVVAPRTTVAELEEAR